VPAEAVVRPDQIEQFAGALSRVVSRLKRLMVACESRAPLSMAQFRAFQCVGEGARPSEIARGCEITSSAATAVVDSLVEAGFCERIHSTTDRREILVRPTPAGRAAFAATKAAMDDLLAGILADWPADRIATLTTLLNDFDAAIDRHALKESR
jgi:DNA-binding MarR family transcriptional regulator